MANCFEKYKYINISKNNTIVVYPYHTDKEMGFFVRASYTEFNPNEDYELTYKQAKQVLKSNPIYKIDLRKITNVNLKQILIDWLNKNTIENTQIISE